MQIAQMAKDANPYPCDRGRVTSVPVKGVAGRSSFLPLPDGRLVLLILAM